MIWKGETVCMIFLFSAASRLLGRCLKGIEKASRVGEGESDGEVFRFYERVGCIETLK